MGPLPLPFMFFYMGILVFSNSHYDAFDFEIKDHKQTFLYRTCVQAFTFSTISQYISEVPEEMVKAINAKVWILVLYCNM